MRLDATTDHDQVRTDGGAQAANTSTLDGDVAVVTGSSRGMGRATAERLAADGASVVVNYVSSEDTAQAVGLDSLDDQIGRASCRERVCLYV